MTRQTIDYGIDLGTTNSAVAVLSGTETVVINNSTGSAFTPSVVWIDKRERFHIGATAKERLFEDPANCHAEFKRDMGQTGEEAARRFERTGKQLLPEELSAEVLKSLKADVRSSAGEDLQAVVITVPAAFEADQTAATQRAAELAGFGHSLLLQEPVAAALAYGFQQAEEKAFWFVYDFGGGTFDAAVIQLTEGVIDVVNHAGDNRLGGKDVDEKILDQLLLPALVEQAGLKGFERSDPKWRTVLAKLKSEAEKAKIVVCRSEAPHEIWIPDLLDADGESHEFTFVLTPGHVEQITQPFLERSLRLCRQALKEKRLKGSDMQRVLMVGGSSMNPWVRRAVQAELGAPLEHSIDAMTVVARGAAVFAGAQRLPEDPQRPVEQGVFRVQLEYEPVGPEEDTDVAGKVEHPAGASLEGYTVELVEERSQWRSGKMVLGAPGSFFAEVTGERGRRNEFRIELCDPTGTALVTSPASLPYTVGVAPPNAPLTHSIGVAMANDEVDLFARKGDSLPAKRSTVHRTAHVLSAGQAESKLRIPVVEGEHRRADRNTLIGYLELAGDNPRVRRDLPVGSEVEIQITIDASRVIHARAFIPILDEEIEETMSYVRDSLDVGQLKKSYEEQLVRLADVRGQAETTGDLKARSALVELDREDVVGQVSVLLIAVEGDREAVREAEKRLRDLKAAIDAAEDALEWPNLLKGADEARKAVREWVDTWGDSGEKQRLRTCEADLQRAIDQGDPDQLRRQTSELWNLGGAVLQRQPSWWLYKLDSLEEQKGLMTNRSQADQLISQGRRAINNNDIESLKAACNQLSGLLPADQRTADVAGFGGSTIRP